MSLARIVFEKRKLEKRYGVEGRVAGHYVEAGYTVAMRFPTPEGTLSFTARKEGTVLAVDVVYGSVKVTADTVKKLARKAAAIKAKPVLVLYGSGPVLTEDALAAAREEGVSIKRIR
ncbi:MAG: hypothetical protein GXO15_06250 [Crenarchaeota archaeon]|nr:hypothetical protein [Thermoproteota archaeon]